MMENTRNLAENLRRYFHILYFVIESINSLRKLNNTRMYNCTVLKYYIVETKISTFKVVVVFLPVFSFS